jgi:hypothetical protein
VTITLVIIFAIGVLLGIAFGLPALRRSPVGRERDVDVVRPAQPGEIADRDAPPEPAQDQPEDLSNPTAEAAGYDTPTCLAFVSTLGDGVIERALVMFEVIAAEGRIDSTELAERLSIAPSTLGGRLTGWLNRRAQNLGLEPPYVVERGEGRTVWRDRDMIAPALLEALRREAAERGVGTAPESSGDGPAQLRSEGS